MLESGLDDSGCVCMIKVRSISEISLYCVETKEYCEQNETLEIFFTKMRLFGECLVNESKARVLLSIPRQGFNRLIQSCPIV